VSDALSIQWRGPLESCNYGCAYCPFAARRSSRSVLVADEAALGRFVRWVEKSEERDFEILFTPRGEALIHRCYREALVRLSHVPRVRRVAIQTNGSAPWDWLASSSIPALGLWITWHPSEVTADVFLRQIAPVLGHGVAFSVGCVGVPAHLSLIEDLRRRLPATVGLWVNARRPNGRYSPDEIARFSLLDPQFELTSRRHPSRGRACRAGLSAIAVSGDGSIRRCHFVAEVLGNLFSDDLCDLLRDRPCPRSACECYLGFVNLEALRLESVYGDGLLTRKVSSS
jgi:MoaA/NifB/PqqE/SkfB family radical SAM enzyme